MHNINKNNMMVIAILGYNNNIKNHHFRTCKKSQPWHNQRVSN
jgi:hypothetical protein